MPRFNLGAFAGGLASGYTLAQNLDLAQKREQREQERAGREKETHAQLKRIRELGIQELEKLSPITDKELQVRGAKADYELNEVNLKKDLQSFEHETRRLLAQNRRTQAGIEGQLLQGQQQRLPDELGILRDDLNNRVIESIKRQTANVWGVLKLGNKALALDMYNKSSLIMPGEEAKDFSIEEVDTTGADGKPTKEKVLVIQPAKEGGRLLRVPVRRLEELHEQYGARYEKVGKSLVRINRDGKVTQVFSDDEFSSTPEGDIFSKRTGLPPAAAGVNAGKLPGEGRRAQAHADSRVKMAIDKVILPKYGGRFEGDTFIPDPANKEAALRATQLVGEYVRQGMDPEAAGVMAVRQADREKALRDTAGTTAYTGPTPWRK